MKKRIDQLKELAKKGVSKLAKVWSGNFNRRMAIVVAAFILPLALFSLALTIAFGLGAALGAVIVALDQINDDGELEVKFITDNYFENKETEESEDSTDA